MFDDFDRYTKVPDNYTPLEVPPYQPKVHRFSFHSIYGDGMELGRYLQLHVRPKRIGSICYALQRRDRDLLVGRETISSS